MKVPQFEPYIGLEEYKAIKDCFDKNWITEGPKMKEFSSMLKDLMGVQYGVFAPNGTLALYLALKAIGIQPGDEVIVPDFTFLGSASSVEMAGAVPVFVDVNPYNFQIDIDDCKRVLNDKTRAIMPVHIYGMSCNIKSVIEFAEQNNLLVIEDAAQAVGVKYNDKHCGTFGDIGCFSFFADKTITTGEGGFIVTNSEKTYQSLLYLRNQGRIDRGSFIHPEMGYNFRMTDMQFALGIVQFNKLPEIIEKKQGILNSYKKELKDLEEIKFIKIEENSNYIPFRIAAICKNSGNLMKYMEDNGIQSRTFFYPLHRQPCFEYLKHLPGHENSNEDASFPNSIYGYENGVCFPSFVALKEKQIKYVCNVVKGYYSSEK